jgi:hypothetical protein
MYVERRLGVPRKVLRKRMGLKFVSFVWLRVMLASLMTLG